ncbi:MAG: hypothetical protein Q9174_002240 [Haloplaca sp. 1 TL-2023]
MLAPSSGVAPSAVAFPAPASSTPTATSVQKDLSFSYTDTALLPPSFPGVDTTTLNAPFVPQGVSVSCKNCTLTGTIDILQGSIAGNTSSLDSDDDEFSWDQGTFTFQANDFSAHIELEATILPSVDLLSYEAPIPAIGLPGFQIPGIGVVGPIFKPAVVIGTRISSQADFSYGFELTVPNNSSIVLDLGDPESSTVNGFSESSITALPFTTAIQNIALTVSAAFRPQLLLGVSILSSSASLGAGVFFNLPTVSATISQVAQVNSKCEPLPIGNMTSNASTTVDDILQDVFGSLTHVEPAVGLDFGVLAEANLGISNSREVGLQNVVTIFNTTFPLPTTCLSFDPEKSTLGPVPAMATAGGEADTESGMMSAADRTVEDPTERLRYMVGLLLGVTLFFVNL